MFDTDTIECMIEIRPTFYEWNSKLDPRRKLFENRNLWIFLASFTSLLVLTFHKIKLENRNSKEIIWEKEPPKHGQQAQRRCGFCLTSPAIFFVWNVMPTTCVFPMPCKFVPKSLLLQKLVVILIRPVPGQNNQHNPILIINFQNKCTTAGVRRQGIICVHH